MSAGPAAPLERAPAPVPAARRRTNSRGRFALVCVLLAAAVGVLLYKGLLSSLDYFDTVDQALAHRAQLGTSVFRLEGTVVKGSIVGTAGGTDFSLAGQDGREVPVELTGSPPQLFQPCIPIVAIGSFASATSSVFLSSQLEVKHTASYAAAHPGRVRDAACAQG